MSSFFVGLDLGQSHDYKALVVAERLEVPTDTLSSYDGTPLTEPVYHLRHIQRFRLGTPYPVIVEQVKELLDRKPLKGDSHLVVDGTGVGAPVVDLFREGGLSPISVTITGGDATTHEGGNWHVPKRDLVGTLQVLFQTGRLKVAEELPEAQTLVNELMAFQVKISATGHDSYGAWREGSHDDLVLAAALACWYGKWGTPNIRWLYYPSDHEEEPGGMGKRV